MKTQSWSGGQTLLFLTVISSFSVALAAPPVPEQSLREMGVSRGVICVSLPSGGDPRYALNFAKAGELTVLVQVPDRELGDAVRQAADESRLLGTRIFVAEGNGRLHLADNLADGIVALDGSGITEAECLRALRPRGAAFLEGRKIVKPVPEGYDEWTHPFHRPDNNPQSNDRYVKGHFRTQFIEFPKFSPMPEQTVIAGGRMYKAMGHIAHKANHNEYLNTLLCINAFNGTILWKRALPDGFMIHRNTMIATEDALYLGDHESCKVIDGATGEIRDSITAPAELTDGPAWKWMGMQDGVLFALVGHAEVKVETQKSDSPGIGHWPWGMWKGHDYADPDTSFGFGRTLLAIDLKTRKVLWHYRNEDVLDARALVMNRDRIFFYIPGKSLVALDPMSGKLLWKNTNADLLAAIGPNGKAQHYLTGYATTSYMKCNDRYIFFSGPQRKLTVAASAENGNLAWTHPAGNLQLILREDAIYAAGEQNTTGLKLDYSTGKVLSQFPARRACTRATGCADSIFFRASGGTVRVMTESTALVRHIAPMRPPCQDGVLISNGHLYWGPWMCGCQLSLYGNIGLAPVEDTAPIEPENLYSRALVRHVEDLSQAAPLEAAPYDWLQFGGNEERSDLSKARLPDAVNLAWKVKVSDNNLPTAPVAAGGLVFVADRSGAVQALDAASGRQAWKSYASGPVYFPPAISHDRLFIGSADGKVHAFEAKTGRLLWSFRVAPKDQLIPVFGQLISSWPVAGGVAVSGDTVYAAAGITHYDGTWVVALDAVTGSLKAGNATSGIISGEVENGISMQGVPQIRNGELQFLGGGVYEYARYDLKTLACLNDPKVQVHSEFRTAFYPYYPDYNKYVSLEHRLDDGRELSHSANYEGRYFIDLSLRKPRPPGAAEIWKDAAGEFIRRANRERGAGSKDREIWSDASHRRFTSFIVAGDRLLAAGHAEEKPGAPFLASIQIENGADLWRHELPALPVKGGTALDAKGRVFVVTEQGEVMGFAP